MRATDEGYLQTLQDNPIGLVSALAAALGLILTWRKLREDSLRRGEVLDWANRAITTLEGLVMVCILRSYPAFKDESAKRLGQIAFDSAILVEQGRIFFKNQQRENFGATKKPAYRGYRPKILDSLIAAHQIAVRLPASDAKTCHALQCIAEDHLKDFVSLIQKEIGRDRTAALVTKEGGSGFNLDVAIAAVDPARVALVQRMAEFGAARYRELPSWRDVRP